MSNGASVLPSFVTGVEKSGWQLAVALGSAIDAPIVILGDPSTRQRPGIWVYGAHRRLARLVRLHGGV